MPAFRIPDYRCAHSYSPKALRPSRPFPARSLLDVCNDASLRNPAKRARFSIALGRFFEPQGPERILFGGGRCE